MKNTYVFYCLLCASWTEWAGGHAVGVEGRELSFCCSHRFAWKNNKYFCKDPCKTNEDILVTVESGGRAGTGRITLVDSGNGVFCVTVSQLHLSDAGRYWCAVDRPGFDTFTEVHLTVEKAVANETTTVILDTLSSTWTYQNTSSSTPSIFQMDTSANSSIASNCTDGGKNSISAGTVLCYSTAGAVSMLTVLVLAMSCRKRQKQQQVCVGEREVWINTETGSTVFLEKHDEFVDSELNKPEDDQVSFPGFRGHVCMRGFPKANYAAFVCNSESVADCEHGETGEDVQSIKKLSERVPCTHRPKQDPPTSASTAADCSVPLHIYENICCARDPACSSYSAKNVQVQDINPLPPIIPKRPGVGALRKHTNKESCTSKVSSCHSRSCCDSTESRPRSLWFGLDLSGTD